MVMRANPSVNTPLNSSSAASAINGQISGRSLAGMSVDGLSLIDREPRGGQIRMTNAE